MLLRHGDLATLSPVLSPSTPRPRSRLPRVHLLLADSLERHVPILPRHCNLTRSLGRAPPLLPRHSELATFHPIESSRIPSFLSLLPSTDRLYKPCLPSDFDGSEKGGSCFCPWNPSLSLVGPKSHSGPSMFVFGRVLFSSRTPESKVPLTSSHHVVYFPSH